MTTASRPSAKKERVLSALVGRTDKFPPHHTKDSGVGYNLTPSSLLPAVPRLPMRWYARPEGDSHQLRVPPRLALLGKGRSSGSGSTAAVPR